MRIAKPGETEAMYRENLELLPSWLRDTVSGIPEEEFRQKIEVSYNAEGYPVCRYRRNGSCFHITSEHPLREAETWGDLAQPQDSAEIFLYGCGFGYPLFELFEKKTPQSIVIVFERDICLFKSMLHYFELSPLFQTKKIMFFIGDIPCFKEKFSEWFYGMLVSITVSPTVLFTYSAARNFGREYLEIHRFVMKQLSFLTSGLGNSHQDDMIGLHNLLANTKEILKSPYLSCMKDKYRGTPAIIVSNGPSLDKSMPLLKEIQGKGLMICAESAIVPLTKNGIRPDIMAALERTKINYRYHFENRNHSPDIALFALAMVDPRIFPSFAGEKIPIFRQGEGMNCWFNRILGDGSELNAGASVAHLATSIAVYLGADPIVFVGQDLSYGPGGATHSKDAVASQEEGKRTREIIHSFPPVYVEGNNGKMLPSNQLWANFRVGLENIVSGHPEHHFYNATVGGAKIKGTERAELSELIRRYFVEPLPYRVNELIAQERKKVSAADRKVLLDKMIFEVEQNAAQFRELADETNLKKLECERMMLLCAGPEEEKYRDILDETYRQNLASFYQSHGSGLRNFFCLRLLYAYFYLFNTLGSIDTQEKRAHIFDLHRQLFRDLRVVSQSLAVTLEEAAQSLKAARAEWNGGVTS